MRILGIDPGLQITGYGLIETGPGGPRLLEAGCLKSSASAPLERRLAELAAGIREVLAEGNPECVAVEALFSSYKHPTSALQMAHARGVLFLAAAEGRLPVFAYPPARVKKALVGRGAATKSQMQSMIQSVFGLEKPPSPPDVADALAVALCHASAMGKGNLISKKRGRGAMPDWLQEAIDESRKKTRR